MMKHPKRLSLNKWIKENPTKNERDWLLEERCVDESQRQELRELFARIDQLPGHKVEVCPLPLYYTHDPIEGEGVDFSNDPKPTLLEFDFEVGNHFYDLDAPEEIYHISDKALWGETNRKFFYWKAKQLGVDPDLFVKWAYDYFSEMRHDGYKHWRHLYK